MALILITYDKTPQDKQRYRCHEPLCEERTFVLDYTYHGQSRQVKQQIIDMALSSSRIQDTTRVLHVSTNTVMKEGDVSINNSDTYPKKEKGTLCILKMRRSRDLSSQI